MSGLLDLPTYACSTIIYLCMIVLIYIILEPEKIKPIAFFLSAIAISAAFLTLFTNYFNIFFTKSKFKPVNQNFNFTPSGLLIGVALFSFESISTLVNSKLPNLTF